MDRLLLENATVVAEHELREHMDVLLADGKIKMLAPHGAIPFAGGKHDLAGRYLCPGFFDMHVHGGGGVDFTTAAPEDIAKGTAVHLRHGTTSILPTTLSTPIPTLKRAIRNIRMAADAPGGRNIRGVHLEGPFLSPAQAGAQNPENLSLPTDENIRNLLESPDFIRIVGAAPELPGALEMGDVLQKMGIAVSIAHSDADYETCMKAIDHGYTDVTHLYSGCSGVTRKMGYRRGGVVESGLLDDRLTVQIIADGCHLPAELLKLIVRCKGAARISLVTDALFPSGVPMKNGTLVEQSSGIPALYEDGVMKLPDRQAFAGSVATMDRLVRNMVRLAGVPLWEACRMASLTPASVVGMDNVKGRVAEGFDADLTVLDHDLTVNAVYLAGQAVT